MLNPFDSPIGNHLVRMMAETVVFNQQGGQQQGGGQQGGGDGGATAASCFQLAADKITSLTLRYTAPTNDYRIYEYTNYNDNKLYIVSWDGSSAPTSKQKSDYKQFLRGRGANAGSNCTVFANPGFTQESSVDRFNTSVANNAWKQIRDGYEAGRAGCTDSRSPNYNPSALKLDNSCQFYEASTAYSKTSPTAADGVRYEGKIKFMRRSIASDVAAEGKYVSIIERVCTSSTCQAADGTRERTQVWTKTSPVVVWSSNSDLAPTRNAAKAEMDAQIAALAGSYVANCSLQPQQATEWKKVTACDGTTFSIDKQLFTSACNGATEKIIYTTSNGQAFTWLKSSGMSASEYEKNTPADAQGRAGYGGMADYLDSLKAAHEAALPAKPTTYSYTKRGGGGHRGVVGAYDKGVLVVIIQKTPIQEDGCGKKTQDAPQYLVYTYEYTQAPDVPKPEYKGLNEETGIPSVMIPVKINGMSNIQAVNPTQTLGPFDSLPNIDDLLGRRVSGCMDSTAENYNPDANTDDGKCKYPEEDDSDGFGDDYKGFQEPQGANKGVIGLGILAIAGILYFAR